MKSICVHAIALGGLALHAGCVEPVPAPSGESAHAVTNGVLEPAASWPWVVTFKRSGGAQYCQGSLISPGWVLTAGHCADAFGYAGAFPITLQTVDGQIRSIVTLTSPPAGTGRTLHHPDYYSSGPGYIESVQWDAALIRVPPFDTSGSVRPASLPVFEPLIDEVARLGSTQTSIAVPTAPGTVAVAEFRVTSTTTMPDCETSFGHLCSAPVSAAATVQGDSGAGLIREAAAERFVVGLESYGVESDPPSERFTNVARVMPWILDAMRSQRRPNASLTYTVTACRSAPPRSAIRRRADLAEIFPEYDEAPSTVTRTSIAQHPSTGSSFNVFEEWMRAAGGATADLRWSVGDFDGDGDQDLMAAWNDGGNNRLTLWKSTGGSFLPVDWGLPPAMGGWTSATEWIPGDFNGDGRSDLVAAWNDGGAVTLSMFLSNGGGFGGFYQARVRDGAWASTTKYMVGDFTGDGIDDILTAERSVVNGVVGTRLNLRRAGFNASVQRWELQPATTWKAHHGGWDDAMVWLAGRFDGVGNADVMAIWNQGGYATFTMYPSAGSLGGVQSHWTTQEGIWSPTHRWSVGDVDADGYDDVIAAWSDGGSATMSVRRSLGTDLAPQSTWAEKRVVWQPATVWCAGTFDAS